MFGNVPLKSTAKILNDSYTIKYVMIKNVLPSKKEMYSVWLRCRADGAGWVLTDFWDGDMNWFKLACFSTYSFSPAKN